jgi:glycosyltransferase involved in cell wall biosynthesis
MKIFYLSGATLPSDSAQSVHVMKMCRALAGDAKENAVTLFAKGGQGISDEEIFEHYGVDPAFALILSYNPGIRVVRGVLRLLAHKWAVKEKGPADLVYSRDAISIDFAVPEKLWTVYEAHQMPSSPLEVMAIKKLLKRRRLAAIVFISEGLKHDFIKKFPLAKKRPLFVAHDGADIPKKLPVGRELQGRSDVLKVGYTGSLHEGKGMEVLAVLAKEVSDMDFHVVGGSAEQMQEWKARKLPSNLILHGHVPHGEIATYLAAFDILIAPYRSRAKIKSGADIARWMSPLKIFEYMAAQKPILSSDLPVIREVLKDGENALLVAPSDVKAWVAALTRLKDPELRKTLSDNAFRDLEVNYTWQKRARNILKFVDKGN